MSARLIVCEKTGRWAAAMRREPSGRGLPIRETCTLDDCWTELAASPESLVAVEATPANLQPLVERLMLMDRWYPQARVVALGMRPMQRCEWVLREAGAVDALFTTRYVGRLIRIAARHLAARQTAAGPDAGDAWRTLILNRLPWGRFASPATPNKT